MADITIGPYTAGEIPFPLQYTFQDADGNALNLAGYSAKFVYQRRGDSVVERDAILDINPADGAVVYAWVSADLAENGSYSAEFWVGNGANRFASARIIWEVRKALETPDI